MANGDDEEHFELTMVEPPPAPSAGPPPTSPPRLPSNDGLFFRGSMVLGRGFILSSEERDLLVAHDPRNAERIWPYVDGERVQNPTQVPDRFIISFGRVPLAEAELWPDLIAIVRERVKPDRDACHREEWRQFWWCFAEEHAGLYEALAGLETCVVIPHVSKHLVVTSSPTACIFADKVCVLPLGLSALVVLQSRIHESWARRLSSSQQGYLRYDRNAFETFPFPQPDARAVIPALEDVGQRLYDARAGYMIETQQGLTQTYNHLKDPDDHEPRIEELRALHVEMDRAVLDAYGWSDIPVSPYAGSGVEHGNAEAFGDAIIARLRVLNTERAGG